MLTGAQVFDYEGLPVLAKDGKPAYNPAPAGILEVARKHLKECGYSKAATKGDERDRLAKALGLENSDTVEIPAMSDFVDQDEA